MSRWKITIEYDGGLYAGFQKQPDIITVQEEIETAIEKFCQKKISITVAGRTDSGVHAKGQIAHFDLDYKKANDDNRPISGYELAKAINAYLMPKPIAILKAEEVSDDFHARFGAKEKLYSYKIINRPAHLAFEQGFAWWIKRPLNIQAMIEAADAFTGEHDFTSFRDTECQAKSPVRTLDRFWVEATEITGGHEIIIHAQAQSFLHHQVRNMVGSLVMIGEGKWSKEDIDKAFEARDRTAGGPTAPADGLCLISINYP